MLGNLFLLPTHPPPLVCFPIPTRQWTDCESSTRNNAAKRQRAPLRATEVGAGQLDDQTATTSALRRDLEAPTKAFQSCFFAIVRGDSERFFASAFPLPCVPCQGGLTLATYETP